MQQIGGSLGIALLNTIATSATASFAVSHHVVPFSAAAQVHGFRTAFAVSVGILAFAFVVVALLIRRPAAPAGDPASEHERLPDLEPVLVGA
jgi:hypothetical protein